MKLSKALSAFKYTAVSAALISGVATTSAFADTFTFSVDTIAPVTITERQPLLFSSALKLTPAGVCGFAALTAAADWGVDTIQNFALTPALATGIALDTGTPANVTGCADAAATTNNLGHYLISGAANTPVKLTLVSGGADDGSFTFAPQGAYDVLSTTTTGNTDAVAIAADAQATPTLDATGQMALLVGGVITVGINPLTAGSNIPASFDINVVY